MFLLEHSTMRRSLHCSANLLALAILVIYLPCLMSEPMRGHNMNPAKLPFVAALAWKRLPSNPDEAYFCLGSLIAKNLVLTSAHCLDDATYEEVEVVIGSSDLTEAKPKYDVHSWLTFARWASKKDPRLIRLQVNDLAVVWLRNQVKGVEVAKITELRLTDLYGKNARIFGWAGDWYDGRRRFLKEANVKVLTAADCEKRFQSIANFFTPLPKGILCTAADPFVLNTSGDSGGPLLDESDNILGITTGICPESSFNCTEEFADRFRYNFHVDLIDEYRQFIAEMERLYSDGNDFIQFQIE